MEKMQPNRKTRPKAARSFWSRRPSPPRRRRAGWSDRALISLLCALVLQAFLEIPNWAPHLPWLPVTSSPLQRRLLDSWSSLSLPLETLTFAAVFFGILASLSRFELTRLQLTRPLAGVAAALTLVACVASVVSAFELPALWIPVGLASLWVSSSFGLGAGLVTVLASLGLSALAGAGGVLATPLLVRAAALVLLFRGEKSARDGFAASALAGLLSAVTALTLDASSEPFTIAWLGLGMRHLCGGALEGLLFWLTRGAGERLLGHVSRERLVSLLDLSQPLLQRMVQRAPGSFEHSRAMANLAEQAASSIRADALLTRVGAYYHDLGKSFEPKYFVENLEAGETSPHDVLSPHESVAHILRHVTDGVAILRAHGIPEPVVEFAYTHHGTQVVEYFLNRARKADPEVSALEFSYPGMRPSTKETAILMIVDSIEAASRTLDTPDRRRIEEAVRRIVFAKLASGQLDECGLSLRELRIISDRVVETLVHMNHHRIKYPWQEERAEQFGISKEELAPSEESRRFPRAVSEGR